jgi:Putative beta-lactamase-inhibitor-like, PepSY-like
MLRSSGILHTGQMKHFITALLVCLGVAAAAAVLAQESKIEMKDLPATIQKAAKAEESKGATLKGFAKEIEQGKTFYEVETTVNGRARDLLYDSNGQLIEVEEELAHDAVPPAVMKALSAHGTVGKVESVTKGKAVTYESVVKTKAGTSVEVTVDGSGKSVKP